MTGKVIPFRSDPKPEGRIVDRHVYKRFYDQGVQACVSCGKWRGEAHHLIHRARGGDDVLENLVPLCGPCHHAYHDGARVRVSPTVVLTQDGVKKAIGRFLRTEAGDDHCAYLIRKLGSFGAEAFVQVLEGRQV